MVTIEKPGMTSKEFAAWAMVTERTVKAWRARGILGGIKIGQRWFIRPEDVRRFLQSRPTLTGPGADDAPAVEKGEPR